MIKTYNLQVTDDARLDIQMAYLWYKEIHKPLAIQFEDYLEKEIKRLLKNPNSFSDKYKKVKVLYLKKFPFGIHYLIKKDLIIIVGLFHTAQDPVNWEKRKSIN